MKTPPQKFFDRLDKLYSKKEVKSILEALSAERKTSFRINNLKSNTQEIESFLTENKIGFERLDYIPDAYLIEKKDEYFLKGSNIFYDGKIYVQGIASMLPALVLNPKKGETILDVTAAPGSKTTQIASIIKNDGNVIALEKNQIRYDKLNYNLALQGVTCVHTYKIDALNFKYVYNGPAIDKILLDVPCSAEGRINLNIEKTFGFWNVRNIYEKQKLQLELLESVIPFMKKGSELIYSTCTLAPEENEEVIDIILKDYPELSVGEIDLKIPNSRSGLTSFEEKLFSEELKKSIRILPSLTTEGFFICKIVKL